MNPLFDQWADFVERRGDGLRRKGVLSIEVAGCSATFEKWEEPVADDDDAGEQWIEPANAWEDPASYPSGIVPMLHIEPIESEPRR